MTVCRKCGRELKNAQSIMAGIGPVCLEREVFQQRGMRMVRSRGRILFSQTIPRFFEIVEEKKKDD